MDTIMLTIVFLTLFFPTEQDIDNNLHRLTKQLLWGVSFNFIFTVPSACLTNGCLEKLQSKVWVDFFKFEFILSVTLMNESIKIYTLTLRYDEGDSDDHMTYQ